MQMISLLSETSLSTVAAVIITQNYLCILKAHSEESHDRQYLSSVD